MGVCHEIAVLNFGKVIARGKPDEIRQDPAVIEAYLGRTNRPRGVKDRCERASHGVGTSGALRRHRSRQGHRPRAPGRPNYHIVGRQRRRQIDYLVGPFGTAAGERGFDSLRRRRIAESRSPPYRRAGAYPGSRRSGDSHYAFGAGKSASWALTCAETGSTATWKRCSRCSRACAKGWTARREISQAASSRCWRSRGLLCRGLDLLLLDEPSMGLGPILVREIFKTLSALKARGLDDSS